MFGFGKRKKKEEELDEAFDRVFREIREIDDYDNPKRLNHYILDSCEHIIATTKDLKRQQNEYRTLTKYLKDIQAFSIMPRGDHEYLVKVVRQILSLRKSKEDYRTSDPLLSDEEFDRMQQYEDDIPDAIERFKQHEEYQSSIEKDLKYIEAEKDRLSIEYDGISHGREFIKLFSIIVLFAIAALLVVSFLLGQSYDNRLLLIVVFVLGALMAGMLIYSMNLNRASRRKTVRKLNDSIGLLNVERMKYVQVEKAIRYLQERYSVTTSYELSYLWERYQIELERQDKYQKDNDDLERYYRMLEEALDKLSLNDARVWTRRLPALINPEEMEAMRVKLVKRRAALREQIKENTASIKRERDDIDQLMREHNYYVPEIMEILTTVDTICGKVTKESVPPENEGGVKMTENEEKKA